MIKPITSATFILSMATQPMLAAGTAHRCQIDSLTPSEALARNQYVKTCFPKIIWDHASLLNGSRRPATFEDAWQLIHKSLEMNGLRPHPRPNHYTPIYLDKPEADTPLSWAAPKVGPTEADLASPEATQAYCARSENVAPVDPVLGPIGFHLNYRCISSCFAPEVRVYFSDSYVSMKEAFEQKPEQITVLDETSTFDKMSFHLQNIDLWTASIRSEPHDLRVFTTANGQSFRVTPNHPLVTSDGYFREAKDIKTGDSLVRADGNPEQITAIDDQKYFGKVYNVQPEGKSAKGNIIVAEGFLSGSNYIQNEGYEFINERIFRAEIPLDLVR